MVCPSGEKRAPIAPAESGSFPSWETLSESKACAGALSSSASSPATTAMERRITAPTQVV
jgi:hypothetical protein